MSVIYQQYQSSGFDSTALSTQATQESEVRMVELYGTTSYPAIVAQWQSDPSSVPTDGSWGFAHAAQSLLLLETNRANGATNTQLAVTAQQQIERWYVREAIARCKQGIDPWLNPLLWNEDSRLDYWMPLLFINWYLTQL